MPMTLRELHLVCEALPVYMDVGEAGEDLEDFDVDALLRKLREAKPGEVELTHEELEICSNALDSYLYWNVSEQRDRNDGFVFYENCGNSKMDRDDRVPEYVAACREVDVLARKFEVMATEAEDAALDHECAFCGKPSGPDRYCSGACANADFSGRA
jgi:hypothetical protein